MLKQYYIILYQSILGLPYLALSVLLLFLLTVFILILRVIIILLDSVYRPHITQYPYSIIFDKIIPIIFLVSPSLFTLMFLPMIGISYLQIFCIIIIVHMIIIIPILYWWSKLRSWDVSIKSKDLNYITLDNPILYKNIAIVIIYPAIWGIYFSIIRYFRLGNEINLNLVQKFNINFDSIYIYILLTILLWPFISVWIKLILWKFMDFRFWLWFELVKLLEVIHLYFLRYDLYFFIFKYLHKIAFILGTYVSLNPDVYPNTKKYSRFRRLFYTLYYKPYMGFIFVFIVIIVELLFTKGILYYSLFIIFIYSIMYNIGFCLCYLYTMPFVDDVSRADYFSKNWKNPRYPKIFWISFFDSSERYGFDWEFSPQEINEIQILSAKYFIKKSSTISYQLPSRIRTKSLCIRIKGVYKTYNGIRWMHTEIIRPTYQYHPLTAWFARKFEERIVLLRSNWSHYPTILKAEKSGLTTTNLKTHYKNFVDDSIDFRTAVEFNLQTNYLPWVRHKVVLNRFKHQKLDTRNQAEPDLIANFNGSAFIEQRVHGLDQKSGKTAIGLSTIYSKINPEIYMKKLKNFQGQMLYHCQEVITLDKVAIQKVLSKLAASCDNLEAHQIIWANNIHLFPNNFIPPMKIPDHCSMQDLTPEFVQAVASAEIKLIKISEYLYAKKITSSISNIPSEDLFKDSYIQKILSEP